MQEDQVLQARRFLGGNPDAVDERRPVLRFNDEELLDWSDFCTNRPYGVHGYSLPDVQAFTERFSRIVFGHG